MTLLGFKTILHKKCRSGKNSEGPAENSWVLDLCPAKWKQISKSLNMSPFIRRGDIITLERQRWKIIKNERDPPLFTGKLLIKFKNILRNTTQVIISHRVINSCAKSAWYARRQHSYNICKDFLSHNSWMKNWKFTKKYTDQSELAKGFSIYSATWKIAYNLMNKVP